MHGVLIKSELTLDNLANRIRDIFNISPENKNWSVVDQKRDSIYKGGTYYYFKVLGFVIELIANIDEAFLEEFAQWPYYLYIEYCSYSKDENTLHLISEHISKLLKENGLDVMTCDY